MSRPNRVKIVTSQRMAARCLQAIGLSFLPETWIPKGRCEGHKYFVVQNERFDWLAGLSPWKSMYGRMSSSSPSGSESSSPSSKLLGKRKLRVPLETEDDDSVSDSSSSSESDSESEPSRATSPEIPVVSHAEKRRLKKKEKEKLSKPDVTSAGAPKKQKNAKTNADSTSVPTKRQNSVWVGNMSFKTTQDDLKAFFSGISGEITRINMPTKKPIGPGMRGENRGFAYVDFSTPEAKAAAIGLSEQHLIGRRLLIKDGDDFAGRPAIPGTENTPINPSDPSSSNPKAPQSLSKFAQRTLRAQKQPPAPTLFFGNLGFETTDVSLRAFLEAHRTRVKGVKGTKHHGVSAEDDDIGALDQSENKGEKNQTVSSSVETSSNDSWIRKVRMGTFEDSGLCKGFAFVDFTSIENATGALINPKNHHMDGRDLVVEYASAEAVRRGGGGSHAHAKGPTHRPLAKGHHDKRDRTKLNFEDTRIPNGGKRQQREDVEEHVPRDEYSAKRARTEQQGEDFKDKAVRSGKPSNGKRERIRPKPGAALALAKRESAAILPSQGKKIVF